MIISFNVSKDILIIENIVEQRYRNEIWWDLWESPNKTDSMPLYCQEGWLSGEDTKQPMNEQLLDLEVSGKGISGSKELGITV